MKKMSVCFGALAILLSNIMRVIKMKKKKRERKKNVWLLRITPSDMLWGIQVLQGKRIKKRKITVRQHGQHFYRRYLLVDWEIAMVFMF